MKNIRDVSRSDSFVSASLRALLLWALAPALGVGVALFIPTSADASATQTTSDADAPSKDADLQEVVVTGSLIPRARVETSTPITVITAEDIQAKGFATIADALQHASFATGSVQGGGYSGGFTQAVQTLSLFGLSPSYVKYLIDGRPMADYPALYNGTDIVTSISGIPTEMVDHIDILPGGQSSIYGSDAIAGVVNVIMKKKADGLTVDVRDGWDTEGGGGSRRIALADGISFGGVNILAGAQYERTDPVWSFQRSITSRYFGGGSSPQTAERDYLVDGYYGQANGDLYYFLDPSDCTKAASTFGGTLGVRTRMGRGTYCGTFNAPNTTIGNGSENTDAYIRVSDDLNDNVQVFADVMLNHDVTKFSTGPVLFSTGDDSSGPYSYFEDPKVTTGDYLNLQRLYSPEEAGSLGNTIDKDTSNGIRGTLGVQGKIGASSWSYAVDMTYTENKLTEIANLAFEDKINNFYSSIIGPNLGYDPNLGANLYSPNYAAFYTPLTAAQYASFTGDATSYSYTEESLARAQITNAALFKLPGGDAGLAVVFDGGDQGWNYAPDPRFLNGQAYLFTATPGSGHRSRHAATSELRMPIVTMLTVDASARYDDYRVAGQNVDKTTYNLGVEFRPVQPLLIRGRYGTAFKAPTLSDEFQGQSGFYTSATDYYQCSKNGYSGSTLAQCPYAQESIQGSTSGTPGLKPITAKVSDVGVVWSPIERMALTIDYLHWKISDEVEEQDIDQVLKTDSSCLLGQLDVTSPTCVAALAQVTRDANGNLISVATPKINVAQETLNVLTVGINYTLATDRVGNIIFEGSYTDLLKHSQILYPGDPEIDLLNTPGPPGYNTDFKSKENLSVTWNIAKFGTTVYVERYGRTANFLSQQDTGGYSDPGAGRVGTWTLANLSAKYEVISGLVVSGNVNNVFNKGPPPDTSYTGIYSQPYNSLNYNPYGRTFYVEANYRYGK
jgi:outer membrane receptor protein involved in Fe transport